MDTIYTDLTVSFSFDKCRPTNTDRIMPLNKMVNKGQPVRESQCNLNFLSRSQFYYNYRNYFSVSLLKLVQFYCLKYILINIESTPAGLCGERRK